MPSESLYFYGEHHLYVAHLFIITQRNIDSNLITSHFPFATALCDETCIFPFLNQNIIYLYLYLNEFVRRTGFRVLKRKLAIDMYLCMLLWNGAFM